MIGRRHVDLLGNEAEAARRGYRAPRELSLPQWFATGDASYFCGLIARQLRQRAIAHRAAEKFAAAKEADAAADIIEDGRFDWLK